MLNKEVAYLVREDPGVQATGTVTVANQPDPNDTVTIQGVAITFVAASPTGNQVLIGANKAATAVNFLAFLQASTNASISLMTYTKVGDVITAKAKVYRTAGNAYTLATSNAVAFTVSGATLSGGGFSPNVVSDSTHIAINKAIWFLRTDMRGLWLDYEGSISWTGDGGGTTFSVTIPTGYIFDSNRIVGILDGSSDNKAALVGHFRWYDAGNGWIVGAVEALTTSTVKFTITQTLLGTTFANGDGLNFKISCPIRAA